MDASRAIMTPEEVDRCVKECTELFSTYADQTIPDPNEDEQGFLDTWMNILGFETKVVGIGSSVLRSIAQHVYNSQMEEKEVRLDIVSQMILHAELYNYYMAEGASYTEYVTDFARKDAWINEDWLPIQAAADAYDIRIIELNTFRAYHLFEYVPHSKKVKKTIFLCSKRTHTEPMYYKNV